MKRLLINSHWLLYSQFEIDSLRSLRGMPRFTSNWWRFRKGHVIPLAWMICLHDRCAEGVITNSEYFWQDLMVSSWIRARTLSKHVDIGSRVDGFMAHLASFMDIEVLDVRPVTTLIPEVALTRADMMDTTSSASV